MSSAALEGSFGAAIDIDNGIGYGFTGAYNFTNQLALMLDVSWARPDYTATFVPDGPGAPQTVSTKLEIATIQAKGVFYFLDRALTPFLEGGLGWTSVDSNIINGPPITGCWWDFFWGYVCRNFYETYTDTTTSYSVGVGVRWDLTPEYTMRATLGALAIDIDAEGERPNIETLQLEFAWRF
jgi:opacity protein-like surface antigen